MRPLAFLFAFLMLAATANASPPPVNGVLWLGDLQLRFDANRWDVNGAKSEYDIYCKLSDCGGVSIAVTIKPTADACTPGTLHFTGPDVHGPTHVDRFDHAGLTFLVAKANSNCANLAGGPVRACTTYAGKAYLFDAPGQRCRTNQHASDDFNEILQGLQPRR